MGKRITNEGIIINGEYTLRTWVNHFNKGYFNNIDFPTLCDMGGFDWFGNPFYFQERILREFGKKIEYLVNNTNINPDTTYVCFKENCPVVGGLYDDFRICDCESGRVLYCVSKLKKGCYGSTFSGWELWDFADKVNGSSVTHKEIVKGSWNDVVNYFKSI